MYDLKTSSVQCCPYRKVNYENSTKFKYGDPDCSILNVPQHIAASVAVCHYNKKQVPHNIIFMILYLFYSYYLTTYKMFLCEQKCFLLLTCRINVSQ